MDEATGPTGRMWVVVGVVLAAVAVSLAAGSWDDVRRWQGREEADPPTAALDSPRRGVEPVASTEDFALRVLRDWDRRRGRAWARGDAAALRRLYVVGSAAGRRDVVMLRGWTRRGLTVRGIRMQMLEIEVRTVSRRRLVADVTDRLVGAEAVRGTRRVALPHDAPTRRTLVLRRTGGRWLMASAVAR